MKSYQVLQRFIDDGTTHEAGGTAEFDELRASQLVRFGLIAEASEAAFELSSEIESDSETAEADDQPKRKRSK
jgi:hypothetical protein